MLREAECAQRRAAPHSPHGCNTVRSSPRDAQATALLHVGKVAELQSLVETGTIAFLHVLFCQIERGHGGSRPPFPSSQPFKLFCSVSGHLQLPFSASSSSLMKRLRRSRMASSISSAAILRACARRRSSSCRLVVSVSMPGNAAALFQVSSVLRELQLPLGDLLGTAAGDPGSFERKATVRASKRIFSGLHAEQSRYSRRRP